MAKIVYIIIIVVIISCIDANSFRDFSKFEIKTIGLWNEFMHSHKKQKSPQFQSYLNKNFSADSGIFCIYITEVKEGFLINDTLINRTSNFDTSKYERFENIFYNIKNIDNIYSLKKKCDVYKSSKSGELNIIDFSVGNQSSSELTVIWIE